MNASLTVIFASHNGSTVLNRTFEAFCKLTTPNGGWQLIIIDNDSNDATSSIIKSFETLLPITSLCVAERGENFALNSALEHAVGDLLIFTDYDILPDPNWLVTMQKCAASKLDYGLFGGVISPEWPCLTIPKFFKQLDLGMLYAATSLTEGETDNSLIWGANMAVRKHQLSKKCSRQRYYWHGCSNYSFSFNSRKETRLIFNIELWPYKEFIFSSTAIENDWALFAREFERLPDSPIGRSVRLSMAMGFLRLAKGYPSATTVRWKRLKLAGLVATQKLGRRHEMR